MVLNGCTQPAIDSAPQPLDVVCFGELFPLSVGTVDEYPRADTGAEMLSLVPLIAADAAIVALTLSKLGCRVGLISMASSASVLQ